MSGEAPRPLGRLTGVGLGPGDPELMTLRAARVLRQAGVVAYFAKAGRQGHARNIVEGFLHVACREEPLHYPMTTESRFDGPHYVEALRAFYGQATATLAAHLEAGRDVALICEGDPLFFGSFMHLYVRLRERFPTAIVPGVTGMSGCWTAAGTPMTWGDDVLTVLPATLEPAVLARRLREGDAFVVMKIGRNLAKVREALSQAGLLARAIYVERGTMGGERVVSLADKADDLAPYFSIVLVPGEGRRP